MYILYIECANLENNSHAALRIVWCWSPPPLLPSFPLSASSHPGIGHPFANSMLTWWRYVFNHQIAHSLSCKRAAGYNFHSGTLGWEVYICAILLKIYHQSPRLLLFQIRNSLEPIVRKNLLQKLQEVMQPLSKAATMLPPAAIRTDPAVILTAFARYLPSIIKVCLSIYHYSEKPKRGSVSRLSFSITGEVLLDI